MTTGFTHESAVSKTVEYYTPPPLIQRLGLTYDLDPCHPEGDPLPWIPAAQRYTRADNGLILPWRGRIWLNPPYDPEEHPCKPNCKKKRCAKRGHCTDVYTPGIDTWMRLMAEHGHGIALVFARVGTGWFQEHGTTSDAMCFIEGRLRFVGRDGLPVKNEDGKANSAGADSMLLAWGADCVEALERSHLGAMYEMRRAASRVA